MQQCPHVKKEMEITWAANLAATAVRIMIYKDTATPYNKNMLVSHIVPTIIIYIFLCANPDLQKFGSTYDKAQLYSKRLKQHKRLDFSVHIQYTLTWVWCKRCIWKAKGWALYLRFLGFTNIKGHSYIWTDSVLYASTLKICNIDIYSVHYKHSIIFLLLKRMDEVPTTVFFIFWFIQCSDVLKSVLHNFPSLRFQILVW